MIVSPKGQDDANRILRTLMLHRLRVGLKAVLRLPLRDALTSGRYSIICERCAAWIDRHTLDVEYACKRCGTVYRIECAIYAAVPDALDDVGGID